MTLLIALVWMDSVVPKRVSCIRFSHYMDAKRRFSKLSILRTLQLIRNNEVWKYASHLMFAVDSCRVFLHFLLLFQVSVVMHDSLALYLTSYSMSASLNTSAEKIVAKVFRGSSSKPMTKQKKQYPQCKCLRFDSCLSVLLKHK